ncbi:MAG: protein translocase subunit SecF [Nitrospinae bacterium]|nr:protein translocase subunit SecF [Nitrospinota bacterium]
MEVIKPDTQIDFIGKKWIAISISMILIIIGLISLIMKGGFNMGVDFAGGTLIQLKFPEDVSIERIRDGLKDIGVVDSNIQRFGSEREILIRTPLSTDKLEDIGSTVKGGLEKEFTSGIEVQRIEMIGPQIGKDLRRKGLFAFYFSLLFMAVYISGRFEFQWVNSIIMTVAFIAGTLLLLKIFPNISIPLLILIALLITLYFYWFLRLKYALGAIIALIHDVLITATAISLTDKEFTISILAAFLIIIGYSINDTIVIFDRIRENIRLMRKEKLEVIINSSVNQTLSRTLLTSATVFMVVVALFIFGGEVIHDFSFALIIGLIAGTYSTVFIASPIVIACWGSGTGGQDLSAKRKAKS